MKLTRESPRSKDKWKDWPAKEFSNNLSSNPSDCIIFKLLNTLKINNLFLSKSSSSLSYEAIQFQTPTTPQTLILLSTTSPLSIQARFLPSRFPLQPTNIKYIIYHLLEQQGHSSFPNVIYVLLIYFCILQFCCIWDEST